MKKTKKVTETKVTEEIQEVNSASELQSTLSAETVTDTKGSIQPSIATEAATTASPVKKLGRPPVPGSKRQIEMATKAELRAQGLLKRGRKPVEGSKRQAHLAHLAEMKEKGLLTGKKGRPVVPGSTNQVKKAEKQAKIASGIELKPGRPKMIKPEVATTTEQTSA